MINMGRPAHPNTTPAHWRQRHCDTDAAPSERVIFLFYVSP